ncbi:MAG: hypothetical protein HOP28_15610 [Gemmatimonadales bacterium]|nr:hypothetical protein [Gemmatimonadales bacterium]
MIIRMFGTALALLLAAAPSQSRAQAATAPFSCPDTVQRRLGSLAGVWEVQAVFRRGPTAWDSTSATVTITPELGGCLMREHFVGTRYGSPYEYLALWGANGGAELPIQRTFVHSQHGLLGVSAGRFHGDTLVFQQRNIVRGTTVLEEGRFSGIAQPGFTIVDRRTTDDGATWIVTARFYFRYRGRVP